MRLHPAIPYLLRVCLKLPQRAHTILVKEGWKSLLERTVAIFHMPHIDDRSYASWIWLYDRLTAELRQTIRNEITEWGENAPKITIIMPISDAGWRLLHTTIRSLQAQLYPRWELYLSAHVAPSAYVHRRLRELSRKEPRLRADFLQAPAVAADPLSLERGEFVAQIDAGDVVPEHALYWIAREILAQPKADLIFSDEDNIDHNKRRFAPWFKSDWNPALMLAQNAVGRLAVFRRSLLEQVGALRPPFHSAQEYELLLRFANLTSPDRIRHVSRILYHRSSRADAARFDWQVGCRAIVEHLATQGIPVTVRPKGNREFQVEYMIRTRQPRVSILLPTTANPSLLVPCLKSLLGRTTYREFEVLPLVAGRHEKRIQQSNVLTRLVGDARVRVLTYADQPFNYSSISNWGAKQAGGEVLCFLNDDTEVITADWLEQLVARVNLPRVAAVGVMLYYPDNTIQHAGVILGLGGVAGHAHFGMRRGSHGYFGRAYLEQDVSCVTAACMVMRSEVFSELGGFDEGLAVAGNDVDLCIRVRRAGWRILWTPMVEFFHHESASFGPHDRGKQYLHDRALMRRRWEPILDADPFYNRNLSLENQHELAFPPREGGDKFQRLTSFLREEWAHLAPYDRTQALPPEGRVRAAVSLVGPRQ
jgi:cellulose synthase/poly-beta-1,6-N-acetylglucosamine synthase-like glycosyltransferase